MAEIAEPKLTREQLEANVNVAKEWLNALRKGTFPGETVPSVAGLLAFIADQYQKSLKEYEQESLTHPEWRMNKICDRCRKAQGKEFVAKEWLCINCLQHELNEKTKTAMPVAAVQ